MKISAPMAQRPPDDDHDTADPVVTDDSVPTADPESDDGSPDADADADADDSTPPATGRSFTGVVAFVLLPLFAMLLAGACGYLTWKVQTGRDTVTARIESTQAAKDSTIALLSYSPDTVDKQLGAARDLLTGTFRDSYTTLTTDVVIPSAKQKQISAAATVSAVAPTAVSPRHAEAMVFVNQTTIVGSGAPTGTSSVVRVTLDKVDGKWLISSFDPV